MGPVRWLGDVGFIVPRDYFLDGVCRRLDRYRSGLIALTRCVT